MAEYSSRQMKVLPAHPGGVRELKQSDVKSSSRLRLRQQNVFARLQALFPTTSSPRATIVHAPVPAESRPISDASSRSSPRFLKIRVVSWNMHDSLPKGNLEDLLGAVPPYVPCPENEANKLRIPNMSSNDSHPYHLVVVAGQECPTSSGIPMGLGASFRHKEKDRTRDGEKGAKKAKGKDGKEKDKHVANEQVPSTASNPPLTPMGDAPQVAGSHGSSSGWSWILEEWYCHGLGQRDESSGTSSASELYESQAASTGLCPQAQGSSADKESNAMCMGEEERKKKDDEKKRKRRCKDRTRVGPYELLVKERLMGIYMAIFVYRDVKPLVRGISKSSVSTGLIGGRVGNKGGVGISVNIDGTTLLFINAHLTAHEERVMSRVANFMKIKAELQVDDFLSQYDPRVMAEDLLDKFDYTFLFGDLNFRLDVTRLHADWLISRKDYDQALSFDQLRALMKDGEAFVGFKEAPICFPPTFKYDVMKSLKRDKSGGSRDLGRALSGKRWFGGRSNQNLSEVQEADTEVPTHLGDGEPGGSMDADDDAGSFVSIAVTATSMQSRSLLNADSGNNDGLLARSASPQVSVKSKDEGAAVNNNAARKLFSTKAALKAKIKWLSLLKQNASRSPISRNASKASQRSSFSVSYPQLKPHSANSDSASSAFRAAASAVELTRQSAPSFVELRRTSSKKSVKSTKSLNILASTNDKEKLQQGSGSGQGLYDTSSKQRVPSWCDRILWKTTVKPEPESEDEDEATFPDNRNSGLGPRMLAFLTHALRPLASRGRTGSITSLHPVSTTDVPPPLPEKDISRPATARSDSQPLTGRASISSEKDPALVKVKAVTNLVNLRRLSHRKLRNPKLSKSRSIEPTLPTRSLSARKRPSRAYTAMPVISAPNVTVAEGATLTPVVTNTGAPPVPPKDDVARQRTTSTRGWLRLPFFSREAEIEPLATNIDIDSPQKQGAAPSRSHKPRRGEVVALNYNSLDDQAMRSLRGRSDHRPVIGSYIIYI